MKSILALMRLEMGSARWVLALGAVVGLLGLAPPLRNFERASAVEVWSATSPLLALLVAAASALVFGVGSAISDGAGGLRFLLARPVGIAAVAAARWIAQALVALGASVLAAAPAWLAAWVAGGSGPDLWRQEAWVGLGTAALVWLVVRFAAEAVAAAVLDRSAWLALDLVLALLLGVLAWRFFDTFGPGGPFSMAAGLAAAVVLGVLLPVVLAGGWARLVGGRGEPRRGHAIGVVAALLAAAPTTFAAHRWADFVQAPAAFADLEISYLETTAIPGLLRARGEAVWRPWWPHAVVALEGGEPLLYDWSADAGAAVLGLRWLAEGGFAVDLLRDGPNHRVEVVPTAVVLDLPRWFYTGHVGFAVDPTGRQLAWCSRGRCEVQDLASGRVVASRNMPWQGYFVLAWVEGQAFGLDTTTSPEGATILHRFALAGGPVTEIKLGDGGGEAAAELELGMVVRAAGPHWIMPLADGRIAVRWAERIVLVDGEAVVGRALEVPSDPALRRPGGVGEGPAGLLAVGMGKDAGHRRLELLDGSLAAVRVVDLPARGRVCGWLDPEALLLATPTGLERLSLDGERTAIVSPWTSCVPQLSVGVPALLVDADRRYGVWPVGAAAPFPLADVSGNEQLARMREE